MMLDHALAALARGWHIFPLPALSKEPRHRFTIGRTADGERLGWAHYATNDLATVLDWWTRDPNANIGVACKQSELLVVDCDVAKVDMNLRGTPFARLHDELGALRINGFDVLAVYANDNGATWEDFNTLSVRTRAGGLHLYYSWPAYFPVAVQTSIVKGCVDTRGNGGQFGGYVLAPGSVVYADGYAGRYDIEMESPIIPAPQWARTIVMPPRPKQPKQPNGYRQPGSVSTSGLVDSVMNAHPGNRNNALLWAARTMCEEGADIAKAEEQLVPAAQHAGLDDFEIEQTIRSAYRLQNYKDGR